MPMTLDTSFHLPVLLQETIEGLSVTRNKKYIDATLGGGGHSLEIIKSGGVLLGIDQDIEAIKYFTKLLNDSNLQNLISNKIFLVQDNFVHLKKIAEKNGFKKTSGILFDLGVSSYQISASTRGFSYLDTQELDMRMDQRTSLTAKEIINKFKAEELYEIFTTYSEELYSRTIADAIIRARALKKILTGSDLVEILKNILSKINAGMPDYKFEKLLLKTSARIFQALRIRVNNELDYLKVALDQALELLDFNGRLAVISYHSLEDRIVKIKFREWERCDKVKLINRQPIISSVFEQQSNHKSRSAKLRIAAKL